MERQLILIRDINRRKDLHFSFNYGSCIVSLKKSKNYSEKILIEKIRELKNLSTVLLTFKEVNDALGRQKSGLDLEDSLHYVVADITCSTVQT